VRAAGGTTEILGSHAITDLLPLAADPVHGILSGWHIAAGLGAVEHPQQQPPVRPQLGEEPVGHRLPLAALDGQCPGQLYIVSTAGTEFSAYFRGKVDEGRARCETGLTGGSAYFGWSAPDDADPGDPATWAACMPALGITVSEATVAADFETMDLSEFRRSCLCQWPEVARPGWKLFSEADYLEATQ
jgi:hypothetical protein